MSNDFIPELLGITAEHWCLYYRDSGEHNYTMGHRGKLVCSGCGKTKK